ncbi:noggin-2-like isoform X1 [Diprion similis]|uniref:noggin-2-like isoform X1 n=2 Tax=Diprion similis TaxID=362088 RepID=UPI001EF8C356|nr:noggin-2-like isoform X1 [Diprion similis]
MTRHLMRTCISRWGGWWVAVLLSLPFLQSRTRGDSQNGSGSPHDHGLRPAESWLSVLLPESTDNALDPPPEEREETRLLALLGADYDAEFMSNSRPNATARLSWEFPFRADHRGRLVPTGDMPEALQALHLGRQFFLSYVRLPDGSRLRTRVSEKLKRKLRRLLWAYTSCPVQWRWKDLGIRFWPRWLKQGRCSQGKGISCSVPPGMKCRPSNTNYKKFLRWHCLREGECKWRPVEYPVITQCACSCSHVIHFKSADTTQV